MINKPVKELIWPDDFINKVICGDCLEVLKKIPDGAVDLVVTSPPYNANLRIRNDIYCSANYGSRIKYNEFTDDMPIDVYINQQKNVLHYLIKKAKSHVFYNIQLITGNKRAIPHIWSEFSSYLKDIIVWGKLHGEPAISDGVLNSSFEFIFIFSNDKPLHRKFSSVNFDRGTFENIIRIGKNNSNTYPGKLSAAMPIELASKIIKTFSNPTDLILDCFLGSGTTAVAAKQLGRKYIGIEISEEYCKIAEERLRQEELFNPEVVK